MLKTRVLHSGQKGMAVVEMAIVTPLFLLMMFGIMEFGVILFDKAVITTASREAARAGIVSRSPPLGPTQIMAVGNAFAANVVGTGSAPPATTVSTLAPDAVGTPLSVTVTYNYQPLVLSTLGQLFGGGLISNPVQLKATTTMYME